MRIGTIAVLIAVSALCCVGQQQIRADKQKFETIHSGSTSREVSVPRLQIEPRVVRQLTMPSLNYWSTPQCDEEGNAYIHSAANINDAVVTKLELTRDDAVVYRWDRSNTWTGFVRFSVSPSGEVWFLGIDAKGGLFVVGFNSAGHETSRTNLDIPTYYEAEKFAVISGRWFLVSGFFGQLSDEQYRGQRFSAIYDKSGKIAKELKHHDDNTSADLKKAAQMLPEGAAVPGPDDNLYVLQANRVLVVSPSGETIRKLPADKPVPEAVASHLWISKDYQIAVSFDVPDKEEPAKLYPEFLVLNALTGVPKGYYSISRAFHGNAVCFSGQEFTLISRESGRILLLKADVQ